jgi:hypothetical protein
LPEKEIAFCRPSRILATGKVGGYQYWQDAEVVELTSDGTGSIAAIAI